MAVNVPVQIDRQRIRELIEREEKALNDATHKSEEMYKRAHAVLTGGVASSYHGNHDTVMVSIGVEYDKIGDRDNLASLPYGAGIPQATVDMTIAVPFNDAGAMERRIERLADEGRLPACVIMEAAMMNLGVVLPEDGYLQAVRDICTRHGIVLIFDEVKT